MVFDVKPRGAGSAGAILSDASVAKVYGEFGDGCERCYRFDIRAKRTFMSAKVLRQVQSFVQDYGEEDAVKIVRTMFGVGHEGVWKGSPIGTSLFGKNFRWLSDMLLIEAEQSKLSLNEPDVEVVGDAKVEIVSFIE